MAEPLKNYYGPDVPRKIAKMISHVHSDFASDAFLQEVLNGYDQLELMPRGRHMAKVLVKYLPGDFRKAAEILVASMGGKHDRTEGFGMGPFLYLPYAFYIADQGIDYWEEAMRAQYELTQRFTAEFSIRPFLIRYPEKTLARLMTWTSDPSVHVRRLVSEGTRPRLPWAQRLPAFQKDPSPVLRLLEKLKDDPEIYVRRSVANNLNDIGKDNPHILFDVAQRWIKNASGPREMLVRHALRSVIKAGHPKALKILGFGAGVKFKIAKPRVEKMKKGDKKQVEISFELVNSSEKSDRFLVDFQIYYRKANGGTSKKVFKLSERTLKPKEHAAFRKIVSLENMTTRKHYPGRHEVEALINGQVVKIGSFVI